MPTLNRKITADETLQEEMYHNLQAMQFKVQCLWREYEDLVSREHNEMRAAKLRDEIDVLEANIKDLE